jgi:hypothetical protein
MKKILTVIITIKEKIKRLFCKHNYVLVEQLENPHGVLQQCTKCGQFYELHPMTASAVYWGNYKIFVKKSQE